MGVIYKDGILYGNNTKIVELTQAEFDALTPAQKADTTKMYFVTDASSGGGTWGSITGTLSDQTDLKNALDAKVDIVSGKGLSTNDYDNTAKGIVDGIPLTVQQLQASLLNKISSTEKGANNGIATLNASGKVPEGQLPSYVDDVIEGYYNTTDHKFYEESTYTTEIVGEQGKIYVSLDTDTCYRWSGSAFIEITSGGTWGSIVGTLSDQTDLQAALDEKTTEEVTENLVRDTVGWTGKNLLPNKAVSQTINGITFTVNIDGSITAIGTASDKADFRILTNYINDEDVILSGCPVGGSSSTYKLQLYDNTAQQGYNDYGEGVIISSLEHNCLIQIVIYSGQTVDNITFYPMLRKTSILDPTYEPYHENVEEYVPEIAEGKACLFTKDAVGWTGKNHIRFNNVKAGASYATVNADGSIVEIKNSTATTYASTQYKVNVDANT